jgi:hypothetical protein
LAGLPHLNTSGLPVAGPVLVRSLTTFSDNGVPYDWSVTMGSIVLSNSGKNSEVQSITTLMNNSGVNGVTSTQCAVGVLLDEISGDPENLPNSVPDPPGQVATSTVLGRRFYLLQADADVPVCQHIQVTVSGGTETTTDEMLAITILGALVSEQQ